MYLTTRTVEGLWTYKNQSKVVVLQSASHRMFFDSFCRSIRAESEMCAPRRDDTSDGIFGTGGGMHRSILSQNEEMSYVETELHKFVVQVEGEKQGQG